MITVAMVYGQFYYEEKGHSLTPKAFYREVLEQLGLPLPFHARQVRRRCEEAILEAYRRDGRQPVLVLDEAHLLSEPMLQEIRFLKLSHGLGGAAELDPGVPAGTT